MDLTRKEIAEEACSSLAELGKCYATDGKSEAATIATCSAGIMLALLLLNSTLEEIRDAIKESKL